MSNNKEGAKQNYLQFNKEVFSKRRNESYEMLYDWRINQNPYNDNRPIKTIIDEDQKIIAQIIPIFAQMHSQGKVIPCVWGSDLIVHPSQRGKGLGKKLMNQITDDFIYNAIGMSDMSTRLHTSYGCEKLGVRNDQLFVAGKRSQVKYKLSSFKHFLEGHIKYQSLYDDYNYFSRGKPFYEWVFKFADPKKLSIIEDVESNGFLIFYKTKMKGLPVSFLVDYSPNYNSEIQRLVDLINAYSKSTIKKLIFYSGSIDLSSSFTTLRNKAHDFVSNIKTKNVDFDYDRKWHITGLESDRFINHFL